jgi:hypothetical protein
MNLPSSAGVIGIGLPPKSSNRAFMLGSARRPRRGHAAEHRHKLAPSYFRAWRLPRAVGPPHRQPTAKWGPGRCGALPHSGRWPVRVRLGPSPFGANVCFRRVRTRAATAVRWSAAQFCLNVGCCGEQDLPQSVDHRPRDRIVPAESVRKLRALFDAPSAHIACCKIWWPPTPVCHCAISEYCDHIPGTSAWVPGQSR